MSTLELEEENLQTIVELIDGKIKRDLEERDTHIRRLKALREEEFEKLTKVREKLYSSRAFFTSTNKALEQQKSSTEQSTKSATRENAAPPPPPPALISTAPILSTMQLKQTDHQSDIAESHADYNSSLARENHDRAYEQIVMREGKRIEALPGKNDEYSHCQFGMMQAPDMQCREKIFCKKVCRIHYHRLARLGLLKGADGDAIALSKSPEKRKHSDAQTRTSKRTRSTASTALNQDQSSDDDDGGGGGGGGGTDADNARDISMPLK